MEINKMNWELVSQEEKDAEKIVRPSLTYWEDVWRRFKSNKVSVASAVFLILLVLGAIFIPFFWPHSYSDQNLMRTQSAARKRIHIWY